MRTIVPCCMCGAMLTSSVQKQSRKIDRQVKFDHMGNVMLHQEFGRTRVVCPVCVSSMEKNGHVFLGDRTVYKHYAEDGNSALVPYPDLPMPERTVKIDRSIENAVLKKNFSYKDIQILYLTDGLQAVKDLYYSKQVKSGVIWRAAHYFRAAGKRAADLDGWCKEVFGGGRPAPEKGTRRVYRAQQLRNSGPFIRLPVDSLSAQKGHLINVFFEGDSIVVKAIPR